MWLQQDRATSHTTYANRILLQEKFPGCVISRWNDVNRPTRSCYLTPLDFLLWVYSKDRVYAYNPQNLEQLKANICEVMAEILLKCAENLLKITSKRSSPLRGLVKEILMMLCFTYDGKIYNEKKFSFHLNIIWFFFSFTFHAWNEERCT